MDTLHLISVSESAMRELTATGARLVVRISGQSFFTGTQAFKKAAEVADCIASLAECGVSEDDIRLLNVTAEVESGFLTKSSSATYDLEVKCRSIDSLAPVIAAISAQKNSKIASVAWDYPDLADTRKIVLHDAVRAAHTSATSIAAALSIPLLGVHKLSYEVSGLDTNLDIPGRPISRKSTAVRRRSAVDFVPELVFSHTTEIVMKVTADFLVGTFPNGT